VTSRSVHAVIVAYHAAEDLDRCLTELRREVEVTVVDNSSSPAVRGVTRAQGAEYIDSGRNVGFGGGVNLALRDLITGQSRDVLLLNPDAMLAPRDLQMLAAYLHRPGNERVAAVSPRLVDAAGADQRVVWPFPTPGRACAEALGLGRLPSRRRFVIGAVVLLRREALLEVGLFDERFFLYAEETDWQRRALALGWSSRLCSEAVASHLGAGTSDGPFIREALFHAANETYIRKWHGTMGWWLYRFAACLGAAARAVVLVGERRAGAARRAVLYFRGPRRCAALVRD
jgi:GT2 family glycosyltransferase